MASPKSGKACTSVGPTGPKAPTAADVANPGEVEEVKAEQRKTQSGKYGTAAVKPYTPPEGIELTWIEVKLIGEDDRPIPGEPYRITLPDGSISSGTLDSDGLARIELIPEGDCKICFPRLDKDAWEPVS